MLKPETLAYLRDWLDWVERGAPNGRPYHRAIGLCSNVRHYPGLEGGSTRNDLCDDLAAAFRRDDTFANPQYPFGYDDYYDGKDNDTQHECPKRLAWVREQLRSAE